MPGQLSPARVLAARGLINVFGGFPIPAAALLASRSAVAMLAVGKDADPSAAKLVHELFAQTSPAGPAPIIITSKALSADISQRRVIQLGHVTAN